MYAAIKSIEYYLPQKTLTNEELANDYPEWSVDKIQAKTGIKERHIVESKECASDLAFFAAKKIFASGVCLPSEIDFLLLCTQSPDYFLPTTACVLQNRLGVSVGCGALDFNLGCSGYIYGLSLAKGLVESNQARNVLLVTAETYSKYIKDDDKSVRTIFGDAAAATLIQASDFSAPAISRVVFGTDGSGFENLIVRRGGWRDPTGSRDLFMNGPEIFTFTLRVVPPLVAKLLADSNISIDAIDLFVFHQANKFMLDHLQNKLKIPPEKFYVYMENIGNTVSSTIPIALKHALLEKKLTFGDLVMLVGFGVGYSWGGTIVKI